MGVFSTVFALVSFQTCPHDEDTKPSEGPFLSNLALNSKANITDFFEAQGLYELKEG